MINPESILNNEVINYIKSRRWFSNKNDEITGVSVYDSFNVDNFLLLILKFQTNMGSYLYYFPVSIGSGEILISCQDNNKIYDAFYSKDYADAILRLFMSETELKGKNGILGFIKTQFFNFNNSNNFATIRAEQSNSSFIMGNIICKNYRFLQYGENPDIRMSVVLIKNGFDNVPAPMGYAVYTSRSGNIYLINISEYIYNSIDLWSYSNKKISSICSEASDYSELEKKIKGFLTGMAGDLGTLTGRMHRVLFYSGEEDFIPVLATMDDFYSVMEETINNLRESGLIEDSIIESLKNKLNIMIKSLDYTGIYKIRIHGDYHLGQIIYSEKYYVIDFEGEPLRKLSERSVRQIPLRDVAGMLRSLSYLIYSSSCIRPDDINEILDNVSVKFVNAYKNVMCSIGIMPEYLFNSIDLFLLQKASYELLYEIKNRPSWIGIPLNEIKRIYKKLCL